MSDGVAMVEKMDGAKKSDMTETNLQWVRRVAQQHMLCRGNME